MMKKSPIDISQIQEDSNGELSISEACIKYMQAEFTENKNDIESNIKKNIQQRLRGGKAVVVEVTDVYCDPDDNGILHVETSVDYSNMPYDSPGKVLSALRLKDEKNNSTGGFVRAIPINKRLELQVKKGIDGLTNCPQLTINEIDLNTSNEKHPTTGRIELEGLRYPGKDTEFKEWKPIPEPPNTKSSSDSSYTIEPGDFYLLDETLSDYGFDSAYNTLQRSEYSALNELIGRMRVENVDNKTTRFDEEEVESFVEWMKSESSSVLPVNDEQEAFITDIESEIAVLQGPPGTGKTSGAIAPKVLAELLSKNDGSPCRTLVTGNSNKSINEVLESTLELLESYQESDETGEELDNVEVVRLEEPPEDPTAFGFNMNEFNTNIRCTSFYNNDAQGKHENEIKNRLLTRKNAIEDSDKHIVIFGTPHKTWRVGDELIKNCVYTNDAPNTFRNREEIPDDVKRRYGLFDSIIADEASMMNLPEFLLAGSFYNGNGHITLSGDHRQLPPVQQHDWESNYKKSIRKYAPYLSALNFIRLLAGDEVKSLSDEERELIEIEGITSKIPIHRLKTTYRCHEDIAKFLKEWVYRKLDGIEYESTQTNTITPQQGQTRGIDEALSPENPLTVITYDDTTHQQTNEIETAITTDILRHINADTTAGIVTPHNAQRALLETELNKFNTEITAPTDVDTVERFQGGERDVIIVSATVSDKDYIETEEEFLLNLNRLNVAMSRMRKKLIVIASESIFNHIPQDVELYNDTLLWKGLAKETGLTANTPQHSWSGNVSDLLCDTRQLSSDDLNTEIQVNHRQ